MARTDSSSQTEVQEIKGLPLLAIGSRVAISAVSHPFEYVKVLIQLGYEPLPPHPTRTLFGRPTLALPGAFKYMRHIKAVDGFFGLYRGLIPKLCSNIVSGYVYSDVMKRIPSRENKKKITEHREPEGAPRDAAETEDGDADKQLEESKSSEEEEEEDEENLSDEERFLRFVRRTLKETAARCAAVIASQPFHVITIRTMAQFVGREDNYRGLFSSTVHIFREDGIRGYFAGIVPRMVGEVLTLWFAHVATYVVNNYIIEEKVLRSYVGTSLLYVASALTYPFTLVCNVMAVNNCGLAAGMPPNMPLYLGWTDAWKHLSSIGQLKRGSSILWRYYTGPLMLDPKGRATYVNKNNFKKP